MIELNSIFDCFYDEELWGEQYREYIRRSLSCTISIIIIILIVMPCHASISSDIFYKFLNESRTVTNVNNIPYSESEYILNNTEQSHKHIRGIVDIVGFKQMVCIDGVYYIPGPAEDHAIIKTKLWGEGLYWNNNLDWIKITDERITTVDNITTVEVDIHLKWHHSELKSRTVCGLNGCRTYKWISKTYYNEYTTFTASHATPQMYPETIIPVINVVIYNNSIAPKTIVYLQDTDYILGYRLEFKNESVEYFNNVLSVETQDTGAQFGNISKVLSQSIYEDSDMFSRVGSNIIINSTEINDSLRIYALTPFDELEINYTVTNYSDVQMLDNVQLSSAFSLLMLAWVIILLLKYYRK